MTSRSILPFLYPRSLVANLGPFSGRAGSPLGPVRFASAAAAPRQAKDKKEKKKKKRNFFINQPLDKIQKFALCDAMRYASKHSVQCIGDLTVCRYIRAFEVGQDPRSAKYDIAVRLRTLKNALTVRGSVQLPHTVDSAIRVCVICPAGSAIAEQAQREGATIVGEESVFEAVKEGRVEFDRCICHEDSLQKLNQSGIARILGPKGLMPSTKLGTVTKDIANTMKTLAGGTEYRERSATIRCAVGQLGFTPQEMQENIRAFVARIKQDCAKISDQVSKEIHEVVCVVDEAHGNLGIC